MILIVYIVFIIGVMAGLFWLKQKMNERSVMRVFHEVFKDSHMKSPALKLGTSYSWPIFGVTFSTKEDLEFAEKSGLIQEFKNKVSARYPKKFDPDRAIYCTYVGHVPKWTTVFEERMRESN